MSQPMPDQISLPLRIAFEVVVQGLRIRLGRSLVTLTGVTCGIAFLMSILTGQLVKKGVAAEDACREEVARMGSFIRSDLPNLRGKAIGLIGSGRLDEVETRVLERLRADGDSILLMADGLAPEPRRPMAGCEVVEGGQLTERAAVIFVMGDGPVPAFDWRRFFDRSRNAMAAYTRTGGARLATDREERWVRLSRDWPPDEIARKALQARQARFRGIWVGVISLLVTVIGISNAMLMSVTERFREIGTMKCLGALSGFVTRLFVLEASLLGFVGGLAGAVAGAVFAVSVYTLTYGAGLVFASLPVASILSFGAVSLVAGILLSIVAALYPARVAASMVPATALRSTL
jgi:hypothetical protein